MKIVVRRQGSKEVDPLTRNLSKDVEVINVSSQINLCQEVGFHETWIIIKIHSRYILGNFLLGIVPEGVEKLY